MIVIVIFLILQSEISREKSFHWIVKDNNQTSKESLKNLGESWEFLGVFFLNDKIKKKEELKK